MRQLFMTLMAASLLVAGQGGAAAVHDPALEPDVGDAVAQPLPRTVLDGARAITAGHGLFVVVGGVDEREPVAKVWTSSDGLTWGQAPTAIRLEGATMDHVLAVDDGFIAMGVDAKGHIAAWHSRDGLAWQRSALARPGHKRMDGGLVAVVKGPAGLLALGTFYGENRGRHRLWRSTDGRTWNALRGPDEIIPGLGIVPGIEMSLSLAAVPDGYLLVGRGGGVGDVSTVWHSEDGRSWRHLKRLRWLVHAATGDDGVVVAISSRDIRATQDLKTWETVGVFPKARVYQGSPSAIHWDGTGFATSGSFSLGTCPRGGACPLQLWLTSADGYSWLESSGPDGKPGADPGVFLLGTAVLEGNTVALGWSADGETVAWSMGSAE